MSPCPFNNFKTSIRYPLNLPPPTPVPRSRSWSHSPFLSLIPSSCVVSIHFPDTLPVFLFWIPLTFHDPLSDPLSICSAIPNPFPIPLSDPITQSRFLFPFCIPVSRFSPTIQFPATVPWSKSTMLFPNPVLCLPSPIPFPIYSSRWSTQIVSPNSSLVPLSVPSSHSLLLPQARPPVRPLWTIT